MLQKFKSNIKFKYIMNTLIYTYELGVLYL